MLKQWFNWGKKSETHETQKVQEQQELSQAVSATRSAMFSGLFSFGKPSEATLNPDEIDSIEETLIRADVGLDLAVELTEPIRKNRSLQTPQGVRDYLKQAFTEALKDSAGQTALRFEAGKLNVYLVVGVNGAGKTTLIGKLAHGFVQGGRTVVIAAADTFRAAAENQLEVWANRAGAQLVRRDGVHPAAVVFDAIQQAKQTQADVLIIDTAGRLQNKFNLMEELKKIKGVMEKEIPEGAIQENLLVLDATTGQNAMQQARIFHQAIQLTGVALTKLDGSAKGGVVFAIAKEFQLPVKLVGIGEKIEDLRQFDPTAFIDALFE